MIELLIHAKQVRMVLAIQSSLSVVSQTSDFFQYMLYICGALAVCAVLCASYSAYIVISKSSIGLTLGFLDQGAKSILNLFSKENTCSQQIIEQISLAIVHLQIAC